MKFLITGDLVVNQSYSALDNIEQELINLFAKSDCNIVNLEAPVTDSEAKILKIGPHLKSNKASTFDVFKKLNIHVAALANNHIKDYDEEGVLDTIDFCHQNAIKTMGAGRNLEDASETFVLNTPEGSVAIVNIAENEWASAGHGSAGANGMNLIKDMRKIQQAKQKYDFVFVVVHGGHEYYNLPSPRMQEQYRFYIDEGADLVVGHHTHCISGYEEYNGKIIYYSLGNFLFTKQSPHSDWYQGLILEVELLNNELKTNLHSVSMEETSFKLALSEGESKIKVLSRIEAYSEIISDSSKLKTSWIEYVNEKSDSYSSVWSILSFIENRIIRGVLRRSPIQFSKVQGWKKSLNFMRCEAHRDLSCATLKLSLNKAYKK